MALLRLGACIGSVNDRLLVIDFWNWCGSYLSSIYIYVVLVQGSKVMLYYECMTLYSKLGYANSNTLNQGVRNRKIIF